MVDPELRVSATPGAAGRLVLSVHLDDQQRIGAPLQAGEHIPKLTPIAASAR
jgi:hypothetical protein